MGRPLQVKTADAELSDLVTGPRMPCLVRRVVATMH